MKFFEGVEVGQIILSRHEGQPLSDAQIGKVTANTANYCEFETEDGAKVTIFGDTKGDPLRGFRGAIIETE